MKIVAKAYAKINWALDILATRENGYHEMDMLMQSISLCDTLTFEPADEVTLITDGAPDPYGEKNLIVRAARLLQRETGCEKGVRMELNKRLPAMAGIGGGSADCAAALKALNVLWNMGISEQQLLELGFSLGADVAFCLAGGLQRVKGLGERLERLNAGQSPEMLLIMPDDGLSTAAVFAEYDKGIRRQPPIEMDAAQEALMSGDYRTLDMLAGNVLTDPAMSMSAAIAPTMDALRAQGAVMARMSGSGSAVFAVFRNAADADAAQQALTKQYGLCERIHTCNEGVTMEIRR